MKKIESGKDLNKLDGVVYELYQLNALIGFMQVAFAEGPSATDEEGRQQPCGISTAGREN